MLTLFACPKPFQGRIARIQRNAIHSWVRLKPTPQIILFGDDEGTGVVAAEMGIKHVPEIMRNPFGTPLVNNLFFQAQSLADHDLLCYVNSDIILMQDLARAVACLHDHPRPVLMVGRCWDLNIDEELHVERGEWEIELQRRVIKKGRPRGPFNIDYSIFTSGLFNGMPAFALGRIRWDNWLIWKALEQQATVVDASHVMQPVHQIHDYGHVPEGKRWSYGGPEARMNQKLAGFWLSIHVYGLMDATHRLTENGLKKRKVILTFVRQMGLRTLFWLRDE